MTSGATHKETAAVEANERSTCSDVGGGSPGRPRFFFFFIPLALEVRWKGGTVKSRSRDTERKGVRCTRQVGGEQWLGTKQGDEIYSLVKQEEVTKASFHNETG